MLLIYLILHVFVLKLRFATKLETILYVDAQFGKVQRDLTAFKIFVDSLFNGTCLYLQFVSWQCNILLLGTQMQSAVDWILCDCVQKRRNTNAQIPHEQFCTLACLLTLLLSLPQLQETALSLCVRPGKNGDVRKTTDGKNI